MVGVIFAAIIPLVPVSSESPEEKISILSAFFLILLDNDHSSSLTETPTNSPTPTEATPTVIIVTATPLPTTQETPRVTIVTATPLPPTIQETPHLTDPTANNLSSNLPIETVSPLPASQRVPSGSIFFPERSSAWGWICSGDFSIAEPKENSDALYDTDENTGTIVILQPDNNVSLYARGNGYCEAYYPEYIDLVKQEFINNIFNRSDNCEGGCSSLNIIELGAQGNILSEDWVN
ncbi:hypothetical protein G4Y79_06595 [Phototrophicus methaneseepsis]|uniref:Uncharacterized protein n=1 Tax=Phototrophicus methaneseepsis TaxID=2710758 RepID=A0A7S8IFX1_9CHLR|nr:hypothetical protein [Phototrophicus methaneseepsis]QPC84042.1 hypothetical protein G4Y79_06595 [Phototrophicus methaneseepsis]